MNDAHRLNAGNLLAAFPPALTGDRNIMALAAAVCAVLASRIQEIDNVSIYSRIDELPEALLDILAKDFAVDWWDVDYTLDEKRATLKDSWRVHRMLGTPAAVITAISAIYPETQVAEWWEYGGEPYHFRLMLDVTHQRVTPEKHARVMERVNFYKNLRSVLDEIEYYDAGGTAAGYAYAACIGSEIVDCAEAVRY